MSGNIRIRGARQNNLKNLDLDLPLGELIVVTGVSGSGKSSLAFDTIYAEGQRRYVETFSPYARQFLDRMDRPQVDRIDGIPPAIAIDQTNPVRTSRSTVGTMTELNDHIKLLFARAARLYCRGCGREVRRDTPGGICEDLLATFGQEAPPALITFELAVPPRFSAEEMRALLAQQGYTRIHADRDAVLEVIQDRLRIAPERRDRLAEAAETALARGQGRLAVRILDEVREPVALRRYSSDLHCPDCDIHYRDPVPNLFSFNSAIGACPTCRGFGRTIGIDPALVVPDEGKTLAEGAVRPFQSESFLDVQGDLMRFARRRGVPTDRPWRALSEEDRRWVMEGEGDWDDRVWYGVRRFFDWLESKRYKMHIRVLLSKYRAYDDCPDCGGARLRDEALDFRLGDRADADAVLEPARRFRGRAVGMAETVWQALPGLHIHDLMGLPLERALAFFDGLHLSAPLDQAVGLLLGEIRSRLRYLLEVGLGYLTLDRQSRTLSGGEVQRINLTTALGTSLVNTLFVLDEPSIGLHPRDIERILGVLRRLRDAGNSLLVVEHDPQIMLGADRLLDIGPGPGEHGGEILFFGRPADLIGGAPRPSLTADYLSGRRRVAAADESAAPDAKTRWIEVLGATEHNLKDLDVRIPLNRLVCVTGVSGSGKSTLIQDVLFNALARLKGRAEETPGAHRALRGHEPLAGVSLLDQSPIGRTSRSNPASYVGAWDAIRKVFAAAPLARERGYGPGTFSFNAGSGRCPTCGGSGLEHVEMQFLSDVYLRCPDCDGRRYRSSVLEVRIEAHSIADVLAMTVSEARAFFAGNSEVARALEPLEAVGLAYLRLGQPVPTLSGGESQRLKLAGHLARSKAGKAGAGELLFLLDEPTTGLHFDDIAVLLRALRRLLRQGHSLVVIEHNLDLIRSADWVIDLGPEGGEGGGKLVCVGTPEEVARHPSSHTGRALREHAGAQPSAIAQAPPAPAPGDAIEILHAREHNLRDLSVRIPRERFTVITGVSGSGKSTLAFDILFAEGQRRYLESLNAYARQFVQPAARPDVGAVLGIPPAVAIEQRTSRGGHKSTLGTLTEIHHFLRLLFVKLGVQYCPDCEIPIEPQSRDEILERITRETRGRRVAILAPLVVNRKGVYNELAKWADRKGYALLRVDGELLPTDDWPRLDRYREHSIDLPVGELRVEPASEPQLRAWVDSALDHGKGLLRVVDLGVSGNNQRTERSFSTHRTCPGCGRGFEEPDPRLFSYNSKHGWCRACFGTGVVLPGFGADQTGEEGEWLAEGPEPQTACPSCEGARLRPEALSVYFKDWTIADYAACSVDEAVEVLRALDLRGRERAIGQDLLSEILGRLSFLQEVGLGYLSLDRAAPTLSGGEAQRIRLAAQLGSNLRGVCYILDEPTIGLHPRDNRMLLDTLYKLRAKGNTVVVVEHDEETIRRAEHLIDLGPGAGRLGGRLVAEGSVQALIAAPESVTGRCLARPLVHPLVRRRPTKAEAYLRVEGARLNNLKDLSLSIPLGRLVCVTGVSGSGKSTLVGDLLVQNLRGLLAAEAQRGRRSVPPLQGCTAITGWRALERVLEVDQTPIGKTPRSCPATYIGFWDAVRRLFAATPEARIHGWGPGRFSFNTAGGRCAACDGQGVRKVEMSFLPDVKVVCEECGGARFNAETLMVRYKGQSVGEVLAMSVDQAADFFSAQPAVQHALGLLQDVGLGYLSLGQQSPTLSGGEAQRIKLVTELAKAREGARRRPAPTLYVLDEPTVGLHMADVGRLVRVLHRLVEAGHSLLVIEHNLDVIAEADWVIDLGPEGGDGGGTLVVEGSPRQVSAAWRKSRTGEALRDFLRRRH